jgi:hypothetical protein
MTCGISGFGVARCSHLVGNLLQWISDGQMDNMGIFYSVERKVVLIGISL